MAKFAGIPRLQRLDVLGRRVLLRADIDVPRSPQGAVLDDAGLRRLLPTLRELLGQRAKVVLAATYSGDQSPEGVAERLGQLLGSPVVVLGRDFDRDVRRLSEGQLALTRGLDDIMPPAAVDPAGDAPRAAWVARVGAAFDVYVIDGLRAACADDPLAVDVPRLLPSRGAGVQVSAAFDAYGQLVDAPAGPYALVLGGSSLTRLLPMAKALLPSCTDLLVGGAVAITFLVAEGFRPGGSLHEPGSLRDAAEFLRSARARSVNIHYPIDAVVRTQSAPGASPNYAVRLLDGPLSPDEAAVDVALQTCNAYRAVLSGSVTALWVGLMGDCSAAETQGGSLRVGQAVGEARRSFVAGDDTIQASFFFGLEARLQAIAGGEAGLDLLAGRAFPGLEALRR